jgi:hypothetical protein
VSAPPAVFYLQGAVRSQVDGPVITAIATLDADTDLDQVRRLPGVRVNVFPLGLEDLYIELFGGSEDGQ